ncbi:MAG: hypothetical protein ACTSSG_03270 [Candidatus Heimdallarchaeaceae archaeon]
MHFPFYVNLVISHLNKDNSVDHSKLSPSEKELCSQLLSVLQLSLQDFLAKTNFSEIEKGKILLALLKRGFDISVISHLLDWKSFEIIISLIFEEIGFSVLSNFRFKVEGTKYEIDVLAFQYPYLLAIDCKFHRNTSNSSLSDFSEKQNERVQALLDTFPQISDELVKHLHLPIRRKLMLLPLIISWRTPTIQFHEHIPIVPYHNLSGFISELDEIRDNLLSYQFELL